MVNSASEFASVDVANFGQVNTLDINHLNATIGHDHGHALARLRYSRLASGDTLLRLNCQFLEAPPLPWSCPSRSDLRLYRP
ncbi:hypothetical protein GCM10010425_03510 [Streptomyces spororaveus]|uniref:Pentapeptide repeat-containing protein n=1 Tax=Streptomyces spororaveus TaxID=284039 RepID=A0ABQ3TD79_9ACTN|nr:hypothetical protein [Streptomyces spororaveus]GHI78369.1 hypothetical protein Sspor_39300 [Streptomyces spororaveus]